MQWIYKNSDSPQKFGKFTKMQKVHSDAAGLQLLWKCNAYIHTTLLYYHHWDWDRDQYQQTIVYILWSNFLTLGFCVVFLLSRNVRVVLCQHTTVWEPNADKSIIFALVGQNNANSSSLDDSHQQITLPRISNFQEYKYGKVFLWQ